MARKLFVVAVLLLAVSIGVLGFQALHYLKLGDWPSVPLQYVWVTLFGERPDPNWLPFGRAWHWLGGLPVSVAGAAAAYLVFLASDMLRRR